MTFSFHRLRRIAWIALLAVLLGALAPTVSRALAAGNGEWIEVCSAGGVQYLPRAADEAPADGTPQHLSVEACAYCLTHAGSFGLAVDAPAGADLPAVQPVFTPTVPPGTLVLAVYGIANPRAPPAHT